MEISTAARRGLADILDALANGESVVLGEFQTDGIADEQAEFVRGIADELRANAS